MKELKLTDVPGITDKLIEYINQDFCTSEGLTALADASNNDPIDATIVTTIRDVASIAARIEKRIATFNNPLASVTLLGLLRKFTAQMLEARRLFHDTIRANATYCGDVAEAVQMTKDLQELSVTLADCVNIEITKILENPELTDALLKKSVEIGVEERAKWEELLKKYNGDTLAATIDVVNGAFNKSFKEFLKKRPVDMLLDALSGKGKVAVNPENPGECDCEDCRKAREKEKNDPWKAAEAQVDGKNDGPDRKN